MPQYVSEDEFRESRMGVDISKLQAGELVRWIERASDAIDDEVHFSFAKHQGVVEKLRSSNDVVVAKEGDVLLYPRRCHPIRTVVALAFGLPGQSAVAVDLDTVEIITDEDGDGKHLQVFGDYGRFRGGRLIWTVTYDGGYDADAADEYPSWLRSCALEWTAGLLQRRGAQAIVIEGAGSVFDSSNVGKHLETAKGYLDHKKRRF